MDLMTWLPVAWFAVIGFGVLMYVVLDGFVLGIGILAPFAEDEEQLDLMMNTAAPIWDGNETLLVLAAPGCWRRSRKPMRCCCRRCTCRCCCCGGAGVPRRGAFDSASRHIVRAACSVGFGLGSLLATFAQGVILGTLVQGIPLVDGAYQGGAFAWFSPFAMLTGGRAGGRLCAAGQHLADPEDGRARAGAGAADDPPAGGGGSRRWAGEQLAAVPRFAVDGPLFSDGQLLVAVAGPAADPGGGGRACGAARPIRAATCRRSCSAWPCSCSASLAWCWACGPTCCSRR